MYSIRHVYTGLYLNSTIPNMTDNSVQNFSESINISKYGELFCSSNEYNWFIAPVKPLDLNNCTETNPNCGVQVAPGRGRKARKQRNKIIANYRNIGGEGNCCDQVFLCVLILISNVLLEFCKCTCQRCDLI